MRRYTTFWTLAICFFACTIKVWSDDYDTFRNAIWDWTSVGNNGAQCGKASFSDLFGGPQVISIAKYCERNLTTKLDYREGLGNATTTSGVATAQNATLAINGSYFNNTPNSATYLYTAVPTWYANQMTTTNEGSARSNGIIGFTGKGTVGIELLDASKYEDMQMRYESFVASGPLLIVGGETQELPIVSESFDGINPRTMIGVTSDSIVYMVVVDGRRSGVARGATVSEMQQLAVWLNLHDAINLDGGGSSTLWAVGKGVLNTPSDGNVRIVPSVVIAHDRSDMTTERLKPGDKFMADGLYYLVADDAQSVTVTYPSKNVPHCWQQSIHGEYQHTSVCGLRRTFLHHNVNRRQRLSLLHH